ncbi:hypothetical protein QJ48_04120 [Paenibacillus sp. A3]|uniref:hypothetical protein n=1 Tax=Paenibacillus sp. A3 TaxID=1337054 RepID=UPI0006D58857|nr:hypothetical protein [Paenibacillus sp. A3]KPV60722.1 hypothetical protein QJ48_04120 [Paenibacillus sp. A3]
MRIYSKKTFQFDHPTGAFPAVVAEKERVADVPDWVAHSTMYQWAVSSGDLERIDSKQEEKAIDSDNKEEKASKPKSQKGASKAKPEAEPSDEGDTETTAEPATDQQQEQQ